MDWQTAILMGIGFVGGVITTSLRKQRQNDSTTSPSLSSPENAALTTSTSKSGTSTSASAAPIEDIPPPPLGVLGTPPDNPQELAHQRLRQLERFKSGFLARTAHELRSPINSVIGLHQLILEDLCETPAEEKQFIGEAKEAAYKVLQLFDTIIAASKLDIGREVPTLEPIALATLFKTLQELTRLQAANSNLRLTFKPTELSVSSDLKWLQMMLLSLIDDAITATKLGDITLEAAAEGKYILLSLAADRSISDLNVSLDTSLYGREVDLSNLSSIYLSTGLTLAVAQEMLKSLNGELILPATNAAPVITVKLPATT